MPDISLPEDEIENINPQNPHIPHAEEDDNEEDVREMESYGDDDRKDTESLFCQKSGSVNSHGENRLFRGRKQKLFWWLRPCGSLIVKYFSFKFNILGYIFISNT